MLIQYASDLHLEFPQNKEFLKSNPLQKAVEILLLAGDIVPFAIMDKHADFFNYVSDHFKVTYWVPGNHEYYYFDAATKSGVLNEKIRSNVFLVNNISVQQENVRLLLSTLWSKISPANQWNVQQNLSDFQVIKYKDGPFSPAHFNQLHEDCLSFIQKELKQLHAGKTVVATHHVPTFMNYPEKYKADALNEAFAVELFDLIETQGPDYWIYGHHHHNTPQFTIGKTQLITNQLGYVKYGEHQNFSPNAVIKING
ncbi:MAG: metallophosphoesterase [Bacteroidetes bacterium]|nr:MAG: metallophosphoesterase [Bacteroidota bacterium]